MIDSETLAKSLHEASRTATKSEITWDRLTESIKELRRFEAIWLMSRFIIEPKPSLENADAKVADAARKGFNS